MLEDAAPVGKRLALMPAGERLLASANEVLATIVHTEDAIRQLSGDRRGVLRITTECYTCYHWQLDNFNSITQLPDYPITRF